MLRALGMRGINRLAVSRT